jgi:hypothetical protein
MPKSQQFSILRQSEILGADEVHYIDYGTLLNSTPDQTLKVHNTHEEHISGKNNAFFQCKTCKFLAEMYTIPDRCIKN